MAGSGPVGINGLPKASPTEYEENGRLYSNFRRYVTLSPALEAPHPFPPFPSIRDPADGLVASTCCPAMNSRKTDLISFTESSKKHVAASC
jgi:hypothetical protein